MKRCFLALFIFGLIHCHASGHCPISNRWQVDRYFSPVSFSENWCSAYRIALKTSDFIINDKIRCNPSFAGKMSRLGDLVSVWVPLADLVATTQHEVFGHGYRLRSLGNEKASISEYAVNIPPPYGPGGGSTSYSISEQYTLTDELATGGAGMEANFVFANVLKYHFWKGGHIDGRMAPLYLFTALDFLTYATITYNLAILNISSEGNDVQEYINAFNLTSSSDPITNKQIRDASFFNLIDPFLWNSIMGLLTYVGAGRDVSLWTLNFGKYRFLPSVQSLLTPFGPEYWLHLQMETPTLYAQFHVRGGEQSGARYGGAGVRFPYIWRKGPFLIGSRLEFWIQPPYQNSSFLTLLDEKNAGVVPPPSMPKNLRAGLLAELYIDIPFGSLPCSAHLETGFKSPGFVPGEDLDSSWICRVGMNVVY